MLNGPVLRYDCAHALCLSHGWSLGEHGDWQKFTNWYAPPDALIDFLDGYSLGRIRSGSRELGARVPLIISAPWIETSVGKRTAVLAELVDIFPTVSDLSGLPLPAGEKLDGKSLKPVLMKPSTDPTDPVAEGLKPWALSQYMRCPADRSNASMFWKSNKCLMTDRTMFPFMGYSLRTPQWRCDDLVACFPACMVATVH